MTKGAITRRLGAVARAVSPRRLCRPAPLLILLIGLVLSLLVAYHAHISDQARLEGVLSLRAEWRARDIQVKIADATNAVQALAVFIGSQQRVEPAEFDTFALQAARLHPVFRLGWAPIVKDEDRARFEAEARRDGDPNYAIRQATAQGLEVAPRRPTYAPLRFERRAPEVMSLLGFDMIAETPTRRAAGLARDSGEPIVTIPIYPLSNRNLGPRYVLFWPIYLDGAHSVAPEDRREQLLGFATGSYVIEQMLRQAILDTPAMSERLSLFISRPVTVDVVPDAVFDPGTSEVRVGAAPLGAPERKGLRLQRSFEELGQSWSMVFDFPPSQVAPLRSGMPTLYLILGLVVTLALALFVAQEQRRRRSVEAMVTERTAALRGATQQLSAIIEASPHAIVCLDRKRHVMLWNRAAEQVFGYSAAEVAGRLTPLVLPEDEERSLGRLRRATAGEVCRNLDGRHRCKDGTVLQTTVSAAPFHDTAGDVIGVVLVIEDVTQRNQIQKKLQQAQKMEAIGQLTGGMAHDFNNLLGIVLGNADLLAERFAPGSDERELADAAMQAATRGAELTRQLLAFARRQPLAPKPADLATVLRGTAHLLRRTLGESVRLELDAPEGLWPVLIDISQLESAILNLAVNARDAMLQGGTLTIEAMNTILDEVAVEQNPEAAAGAYVVIAVSDTGTGMTPEVVSRVFDPFFTTKGATGSGLGLSMVHGFVRQSGGHTKIYSEPDCGTTVRIYLPRSGPRSDRFDAVDIGAVAPGTEVVLVVEDNKGMREIAVRQLETLGYRTIPAADGAQALDILRGAAPVDLLFTDVIMPGGMDGRALAGAARQLRPELRILFTSGFTGGAATAWASADIAERLLSKPYRKDELARRVRSALDSVDLRSA